MGKVLPKAQVRIEKAMVTSGGGSDRAFSRKDVRRKEKKAH